MAKGRELIPFEINGSGFTTVQRFTSRHMSRVDQLYDCINGDPFQGIGKLKVCDGYTPQGNVGSDILGLYGYIMPNGTGRTLRVFGTKVQYWNGSAFVDSNLTTLSVGRKAFFVTFIGRVFLVNGANTFTSTDGISWSNTDQLGGLPITDAEFVEEYEGRIIIANKKDVYWSSLPYTITWSPKFNATVAPDDGDYITGIKRNGYDLLVFKEYSIRRLRIRGDQSYELVTIDETIGTPSARSTINYGGFCYFFGRARNGRKGIYRTNGGGVELISRGVQDWIDAVPSSQWANICAGEKQGVIKWFVGTITTPDGVTCENCELRYSYEDDGWSRRSLKTIPRVYSPCTFGSTLDLYFGGDDGGIYRDDYGSEFVLINGTTYPIQMNITTHLIPLRNINQDSVIDSLNATGHGLKLFKFKYRWDNSKKWTSLENDIEGSRGGIFYNGVLSDDNPSSGSSLQVNITSIKHGAVLEKLQTMMRREAMDIE